MSDGSGPTRSEKFAYDFDVWYTSDPMAEVYMLAAVNGFFCALLFFAFWLTGSLTDLSGFEWFSEMLWMSWGQLSGKAPKARDPDGWLWPTRAVRTFAAFAGMFAFSLIVGFIKSALKARLKNLKLGKGRVFEKNFSMVIGWNDRMLPLIEQLTLANESSGGGVVVVLAPKSKPWMDGFFVDNIEDWKGTKIVTRKGDPINPNDLMKASAPRARSLVVLSQGDDADEADAQACRCTLALTGGMPFLWGHVVVELRDIDNAPVVRMGVPDHWPELTKKRKVLPLIGNDLIGRLMVQCSVEAGLARCFSHILAFAGNEFYFSDGKEWMPMLYGKRFADACFMFADAVCIGIKMSIPKEDGAYIILNPPGTDIIEENDSLLFIAEDDDTYQPGELKLTNCGAPPDFEPPPKPKTKTLLIGWRRDIQDMMFELNKWVEPGSTLVMLSDQPDIETRQAELEDAMCVPDEDLTNLKVHFEQQNPIFRRELERLETPIHEFDAILVLTESRPGAEGLSSDSRSMITMLLCRDLQKQAERELGAKTFGNQLPASQATVISEILDPRTAELIKLAQCDDHIVSNELISMALGQMSEQADIGPLIDDLFSVDGNEMHIKDVRLFAYEGETLSFWEIMNRARQRCEVAIGYQRYADVLADAADKGLTLNPADKSQRITWSPQDKIVVISED